MGTHTSSSRPVKKILLAVSLASLLLVAIIQGCRKIEISAQKTTELTNRFFATKQQPPSTITKVIQKLKNDNASRDFVAGFVAHEGYALWDKAVVKPKPKSSHRNQSANSNSITGSDTLVYIPLVLEGTQYINSFILASINESDTATKWQLYRGREYAAYGFSNSDTALSAKALFRVFVMLDKEAFNHAGLRIKDRRLLSVQDSVGLAHRHHTFDSSRVVYKLKAANSLSRNNVTYMPVDQCDYYEVCQRPGYMTGGPEDEYCDGGCTMSCQYWDHEETVCTTLWLEVPDPPTGGGGGSGSSGGTPSNPPTPPPTNPNDPVTTLDDGWVPELEPDAAPKANPCNKIKAVADTVANPAYMQKTKDLTKAQNLNLGYEKSVSLIDGATPNVRENSGTTAIANVQLPNFPSGQKYTSFSHTHPNATGGTYSIFSFGDLLRISSLKYSGQLDVSKFVAFLTTYKGTYYALTIDNASKFDDFFYYFNVHGDASQGNIVQWSSSQTKANAIQSKYFQHKTDALITETDTDNNNVLDRFLDFMKEADLGATLFETNANFSSFTKVEKDQSGAIRRTNCN